MRAGVAENRDWLLQLGKNIQCDLTGNLRCNNLPERRVLHVAHLAVRVCCELQRQKTLAVYRHTVVNSLTPSSTTAFKIIA
jgi:hypothetical protein